MDADVDASQPVEVDEVARRIVELTDAAFALAAVSDALRPDTAGLAEEHGRVLAELGMAVRREPGGWELVPPLPELPGRVRRGAVVRPGRSDMSCAAGAPA